MNGTSLRHHFLSSALLAGAFLAACADEAPRTEPLDPPSGPGAMAPRLTAGRSGTQLTWLEPVDARSRTEFRLRYSELAGGAWSPPRELARGDAFFANWADLPGAVEGMDGTRYAHWLEKLGSDTYAYGVRLTRSADGGRTWEDVGLLHDDSSPAEHGFVSYVPAPDGVRAFWLDGREMTGAEPGPMQLRTTLLTGGGEPPPSAVLDERVCECCATDAALASAGPIVAYRDRSESEIRDVALVRAVGEDWSEPVVLHADRWEIHGCPVNGPAVDADGERVAVAWFTAAESKPRVAVAFSGDAGTSFGRPIVIDEEAPLGRVDVVLDPDGRAWVSWMATVGTSAEIRLRRAASDGELGATRTLLETTAKRSAGVPRMVRHGGSLVLAWVEDTEPSKVRVALVPIG